MINYSFLRSQKADALQKWHNSPFFEKEELHASSFDDATILPLRQDRGTKLKYGRGGVVKDNSYIPESGIESRYGGYYSCDRVEYSQETVVFCGPLHRQWGHFLLESTARLWYVFENDNSVDKFVFIVPEHSETSISGNFFEFLELLGITPKVQINNTPIQYRKVIIPDLSYCRKQHFSKQYKRVFDSVAENAMNRASSHPDIEKVYLSRSHFKKALQTECGLEMVDNYFQNNGFFILRPEECPLSDCIAIMRNASVCAAESGTLPHNFLFCQDEKDIIIIERQSTVNEMQANIDIIRKLNVTYVDGHYTISVPNAGFGIFFLAYNDLFRQFSETKGYLPPNNKYISEKAIRSDIRKCLRLYKQTYGYQWGFEKWQLMYDNIYYEAYEDSCKALGPYLAREKPLFWTDYFDPHILKILLKNWLKKMQQ